MFVFVPEMFLFFLILIFFFLKYLFLFFSQFREAAEAAIEIKSEDDFDYVMSRLGLADRGVAEVVRGMRGQLGRR